MEVSLWCTLHASFTTTLPFPVNSRWIFTLFALDSVALHNGISLWSLIIGNWPLEIAMDVCRHSRTYIRIRHPSSPTREPISSSWPRHPPTNIPHGNRHYSWESHQLPIGLVQQRHCWSLIGLSVIGFIFLLERRVFSVSYSYSKRRLFSISYSFSNNVCSQFHILTRTTTGKNLLRWVLLKMKVSGMTLLSIWTSILNWFALKDFL